MTVTLSTRHDLTLPAFRRVAWEGEPVVLGRTSRRVLATRASFLALLPDEGRPCTASPAGSEIVRRCNYRPRSGRSRRGRRPIAACRSASHCPGEWSREIVRKAREPPRWPRRSAAAGGRGGRQDAGRCRAPARAVPGQRGLGRDLALGPLRTHGPKTGSRGEGRDRARQWLAMRAALLADGALVPQDG